MTVEELRARGEAFNEALNREAYEAAAGLRAETRFAELFEAYADLASDDAWEGAQGVPALREWVADNRVGRAVASLADRLHAWESAAVLTLPDGERMPYQRAAIAMANEPRRERRLAIDRARRAILAEPAAIRAEQLGREADLLAQLTGEGVVEARSRLSGIALDALAAEGTAFLAATADLYRDALREALRRALDLGPGEAHRSDAAYLFRGVTWDGHFSGDALVPTARRQTGEMGIRLDAGGRVTLDTGDRERKRPRAFCAPVRVPDEIYLVTRPHGGYVDYRAFWHEMGHALHFAHTAADLPMEHRRLGDASVTECWAMLFEYTLVAPAWLRRYAGLGGEALRRFDREQAFATLAMVRRYAAKLSYELQLHRAPSLAAGAAAYADLLTAATGFRYEREDALLDLDDGFYAARYLRAWQLESMLRAALVERFDEDWFRNPRAGPFVVGLMERGQRDDAAALAASVLGRPLAFDALTAQLEAALA